MSRNCVSLGEKRKISSARLLSWDLGPRTHHSVPLESTLKFLYTSIFHTDDFCFLSWHWHYDMIFLSSDSTCGILLTSPLLRDGSTLQASSTRICVRNTCHLHRVTPWYSCAVPLLWLSTPVSQLSRNLGSMPLSGFLSKRKTVCCRFLLLVFKFPHFNLRLHYPIFQLLGWNGLTSFSSTLFPSRKSTV